MADWPAAGPSTPRLARPDRLLGARPFIELARTLLVPLARRVMTVPLRLTAERYGRVPKAYIECLQDAALPIQQQRYPHRRARCETVWPIDAGHSPFLDQPERLVEILARIIET